jgi:HD superfamily phosphohydrolase
MNWPWPFFSCLRENNKNTTEKRTVEIILEKLKIHAFLKSIAWFCPVSCGRDPPNPYSSDVKLFSFQLDTDRIVYLLRDSKMTGAGVRRFDFDVRKTAICQGYDS